MGCVYFCLWSALRPLSSVARYKVVRTNYRTINVGVVMRDVHKMRNCTSTIAHVIFYVFDISVSEYIERFLKSLSG